jgi:hypothetical protein
MDAPLLIAHLYAGYSIATSRGLAYACSGSASAPRSPASGAASFAVVASAQNTGPVIDSVSMRTEMQRYETIYPEFHFHDPSGTVRFIHREITATNSPKPLKVRDGVIEISPEQQMRGAVYTGGWPCGPESYYVTIQAFVMNLDGQKSNVVEYTIHCNRG